MLPLPACSCDRQEERGLTGDCPRDSPGPQFLAALTHDRVPWVLQRLDMAAAGKPQASRAVGDKQRLLTGVIEDHEVADQMHYRDIGLPGSTERSSAGDPLRCHREVPPLLFVPGIDALQHLRQPSTKHPVRSVRGISGSHRPHDARHCDILTALDDIARRPGPGNATLCHRAVVLAA